MSTRRVALIGLVLASGLASAASARRGSGDELARALAGRVAGKPVESIDPSFTTGPTIIDARTILYRENGRRVYVTGPVDRCPALRTHTTLVVELYGSQLCRNDRFRVLEPGTTIPSGYCRFGAFTPYEKPPR